MKKVAFSLIVMALITATYADYAMTINALDTGRYAEANGLARWYVGKPFVAIPIIQITNGAMYWGLEGLRDTKGPWLYIVGGLLLAVKGAVIAHNLKVLK